MKFKEFTKIILGVFILLSSEAYSAVLYGTNGNSIFGLDPNTGSNVFTSGVNVSSLTYGGGVLYGTNGNSIFGLDPNTGSNVFTSGVNVSSLTYTTPVPLPPSIWLFITGAAGLLSIRREKNITISSSGHFIRRLYCALRFAPFFHNTNGV